MIDHLLDPRYDQVGPLLRTSTQTAGDATAETAVHVEGELDMATAPRLSQVLHAALDARPAVLAVDLTTLSFVDSTGIRVLITVQQRAAAQGCRFVLRSPTRSVLKALRLTGVDRHMLIEPAAAPG